MTLNTNKYLNEPCHAGLEEFGLSLHVKSAVRTLSTNMDSIFSCVKKASSRQKWTHKSRHNCEVTYEKQYSPKAKQQEHITAA